MLGKNLVAFRIRQAKARRACGRARRDTGGYHPTDQDLSVGRPQGRGYLLEDTFLFGSGYGQAAYAAPLVDQLFEDAAAVFVALELVEAGAGWR